MTAKAARPAGPIREAAAERWQQVARLACMVAESLRAGHSPDVQEVRALREAMVIADRTQVAFLRSGLAVQTRLTTRELEVLAGIADGKSYAELARDLFVTEDTIKTHVRRLFRKLGANDRAHAVAIGFRQAMLT